MNKVLVLSVHPDDETLGCGGTLLKHKSNGDNIYWLIATSIKGKCGFSKKEVFRRENEIKTVASMYNFDNVFKLEIPTMKISAFSIDEIVNKISKVFHKVEPNIIYLPFRKDVHSDHRIVFEAAYSCTKTFRYPFIRKILMMETISETEFSPGIKDYIFVPNYFVDISEFLNEKLKIMKIYKNECSKHPFPRSIVNLKALAIFRGATAGVKYAEAFMIIKEIF